MTTSVRPPQTPEEITDDLVRRSLEMRIFAHREGNAIRVVDDERIEVRFPAGELRHQAKLPGWETAITFHYSLDIVRELRPGRGDGERTTRHLSIQVSAPDERISQGVMNANRDAWLARWASIAALWFPDDQQLAAHVKAEPPVPVADPQTKHVHYRTPITTHFIAEGRETFGVVPGIVSDEVLEQLTGDKPADPDDLQSLTAAMTSPIAEEPSRAEWIRRIAVEEGISDDEAAAIYDEETRDETAEMEH